MRTRTRSRQINPPLGLKTVLQKRPSWKTAPYGIWHADYPIVQVAPATFNCSNDTRWELCNESDVITDELDKNRRVKYCDHVKRRVSRINYTTCPMGGVGYFYLQNAYQQPIAAMLQGDVVDNDVIHHQAWFHGSSGALTPMNAGLNEQSLINAVGLPPDRLGEVPSRIVKAIEEWHASTTLIEARDLPSLFSLFTKRGPLWGGYDALRKYRRAQNDLCRRFRNRTARQTMFQLARAFREGQLGESFGIMPTVSDALTISRLLREGVKKRQTRIVRTIRDNREQRFNSVAPYDIDGIGRWKRKEFVEYYRCDGACADLVRPAYTNDAFDNYVKRLLGVNGAGLLWEVLPFSFVVDWFLSVDDALDTLWLANQTEYNVQYWSTTKLLYHREIKAYQWTNEVVPPGAPFVYKDWPAPVWAEYSHYNRTPRVPPSPLSSIRFRMGPRQGFLTLLIGLGLLPNSWVSKIRDKL